MQFALGLDQARRNDWGRAVAAFDHAGWFGAANEYTFEHACLRLLAGDAESYRRLVARMVADDGRTTDAARCFVLARTGSLAPGAVPPRPTWCRWGERAARGDPSPWVLHALGLAYLRAGRPLDAIRLLENRRLPPDWDGQVTNWLALALAAPRLAAMTPKPDGGRIGPSPSWTTPARPYSMRQAACACPTGWRPKSSAASLRRRCQTGISRPIRSPARASRNGSNRWRFTTSTCIDTTIAHQNSLAP